MQFKHYALTALASAAFALTAQAQTVQSGSGSVQSGVSTESQSAPRAGERPASSSGTLPTDQMNTRPAPLSPGIASSPLSYEANSAPGVGSPATRDAVRAHTSTELRSGNIPRGEPSTPIQGKRAETTAAEAPWRQYR